jgi:hypothetical protein
MKAVVVLTFEVPDPEALAGVLVAIDPPHLPYFTGEARVTVDPWASALEAFLDRDN